jgi:hypothetical protein
MDDGFLFLIKEISNIMDGFVPKEKPPNCSPSIVITLPFRLAKMRWK